MAHIKNIYLVFHRNTLWNTLFWDSVEAGDVSRQSSCTSELAWFFFPNTVDMWVFHRSMVLMFFFTYLVCLSQTLVHFPPLFRLKNLEKKCIKRKECKVVNFTAYLLQSRASSMCTFLLLLLQMHLANKCIELLMWFIIDAFWLLWSLTGVAKINQMSYTFVTWLNFKAFRLRV